MDQSTLNNWKIWMETRSIFKASKPIQETGDCLTQSNLVIPFKAELNIVLQMAHGEPFVMMDFQWMVQKSSANLLNHFIKQLHGQMWALFLNQEWLYSKVTQTSQFFWMMFNAKEMSHLFWDALKLSLTIVITMKI